MRFFSFIKKVIVAFLARPTRVFVICLAIIVVNMVFKGGFLDILNLNQNLKKVTLQKQKLARDIKDIEMKILRAADPNYLELEVLNRFDLAQEGDLIFVFSDEKSR